jgi:hypothetical protein
MGVVVMHSKMVKSIERVSGTEKNFEKVQRDQCVQNCVVLCLLQRDLLLETQ